MFDSRQQATVFLFLGESNARGQADNSDLSSALKQPNPNMLMVRNDNFKIEPMQIGVNNNLIHDTQGIWHGWENGIQANLSLILGHKFCYICKVGVGGSVIADWDVGKTNWSTYYLNRVGALKTHLAARNIKADWIIFFSLGLNDANQSTSPTAWRPKIENLLARARAEIPQATVPILCPRFSTNMIATTSPQLFNTQLDAIASSDPNFHMIDSSSTAIKSDGLHWTSAAMSLLAVRMIDKYKLLRAA